MSPYFFVLPTIVAVIPMLFIFKVSIERVKEDPNSFQKAYIQFLLWAAIFEVIPIILIVFAFMNAEPVANISDLYMPGIIIFLMAGFAALFVFLQMTVDVVAETKGFVQRFCMLAFMLMLAIPIVSMTGLLTMMPTN